MCPRSKWRWIHLNIAFWEIITLLTGHVVTFKMCTLKGTPAFSLFLFKVFTIYSHFQMKWLNCLPSNLLLSFALSCHLDVHHTEVLNHFLLLALLSIKPRVVALTRLNIFFACSKSLYTVYYTVTAWEKKKQVMQSAASFPELPADHRCLSASRRWFR